MSCIGKDAETGRQKELFWFLPQIPTIAWGWSGLNHKPSLGLWIFQIGGWSQNTWVINSCLPRHMLVES